MTSEHDIVLKFCAKWEAMQATRLTSAPLTTALDEINSAINWNTWLMDHITKCTTCDNAFNHLDDANEGMCEEAFKMFQRCAREQRDTQPDTHNDL